MEKYLKYSCTQDRASIWRNDPYCHRKGPPGQLLMQLILSTACPQMNHLANLKNMWRSWTSSHGDVCRAGAFRSTIAWIEF
jgi:hypothetical protein